MTKIFIVEDEEKIARFLELELVHEGYSVSKESDGRNALDKMLAEQFDLVILDIMLPSLSGTEVLRRFRKVSDVPVIMLTARDSVVDKVSGLDLGADDYMTKPFAIEELLARIRTVLRKSKKSESSDSVLSCGNVILNPSAHTVTVDGNPVELTNREFTLLQTLLQNLDVVMTRDVLLEKVWGFDYVGETNVADVYVRYLRQKGIDIISTVRGVGYVIKSHA